MNRSSLEEGRRAGIWLVDSRSPTENSVRSSGAGAYFDLNGVSSQKFTASLTIIMALIAIL